MSKKTSGLSFIEPIRVEFWENRVLDEAVNLYGAQLMGCATGYMLAETKFQFVCKNLGRVRLGYPELTMEAHKAAKEKQ